MDTNLDFHTPFIYSYETRNITFKPLLGGFCLVCCSRILVETNILVVHSCPSFNPFFIEVKLRYAFTGNFLSNHYSSCMVATLNPWNNIFFFCLWKFLSFCLLETMMSPISQQWTTCKKGTFMPLTACHWRSRKHLLSLICFKRIVRRWSVDRR